MGKAKNITIKLIVELARVLLGITFVFSGFVKSIDPLGTAYKIEDYLTTFGLAQLHSIALPISIALCSLEFCLGVFILFGLYRKWTSRLLFVVMLFMTPLTLYLAIANPVQDCGCFGDALVISNWQTFYKNIILLLCSIATLCWYEKITNLFTGKFYWFVSLFVIACSLSFCIYNYVNEPIIDFRPYKIGANIPQLMTVEDGKAPVYENTFIYEKNGVQEVFTEDNYPWNDSTWVFVKMDTKLVKEGDLPVIHDFSINRLYFNLPRTEVIGKEDITTEVLSDTSYTFLMVSYSLEDAGESYLSRFEDVNNYAKDHKYHFYCLTASPEETILKLEKENITNFDFCQADERTLKTIMRSNPGLMLIKNGVIINKWADRDTPDESMLYDSPLEELTIGETPDVSAENKKTLRNMFLIFLIPLVVVKILDAGLYHRIKISKDEDVNNDNLN